MNVDSLDWSCFRDITYTTLRGVLIEGYHYFMRCADRGISHVEFNEVCCYRDISYTILLGVLLQGYHIY